ncbi:MAG: MFS transporter [Gammaproteobacteria bacterium]|nr:MFS transporter [Gammaproteobacteria bacterium]MDH5277079.1 MFS transporter [Gammaproteobacteria bacterium]
MTPGGTPRFAIPILFAVVFIDLVGFGILAPLIPFYVERLGARPELITLIIAAHPLAQSVATPLWGSLSDRIGRRPVLLASMLGHAASYAMLGFAGSLWMLLLARVVSGATSANISTAYAYIADVTTPAQRARAMGRVSSAFGLGFMIGPALGGLLAGGNTMAEANLVRPAVAAGLFSLAAFLAILVFLPETRQLAPPSAPRAAGSNVFTELRHIAGRPLISQLLAMATVVLIFMSAREAIFTLWANHEHALSARAIGGMLAWSGGLIALVQFFGMGWLSKRFGELNLVKCAIVCLMTGWFGLTLATGIPTLLIAMTIGSFGTAFFQTSMQSLLSKLAGPTERGTVLGVYQSSTSMARFLGQAGAGTLYGQLGSNSPFLLGSLAMLPAFAIATRIGRQRAAAATRESAPHN